MAGAKSMMGKATEREPTEPTSPVAQDEWRSNHTIEIEINQTLEMPCFQNSSSETSSEFTFTWLVEDNGAQEMLIQDHHISSSTSFKDRVKLCANYGLCLSPVQIHDDGRQFSCQVRLRSGKILTSSTTVKVFAKPEIPMIVENSTVNVLGERIFTCSLKNVFPKASLTWFIDGRLLQGEEEDDVFTSTTSEFSEAPTSINGSTNNNHIHITSSHDSFSYWVDEKSPVGPDQTPAIKRLARISLVKKLMKKWSVTQNLTFREQLEAGIRYFDLRVSSKPGDADQEIYFIHGLFGIKVWDGLMEIDSFLTQHPQEIVFLDFNHFYAMDEAHHKCLILRIQEAFGSKLCPACFVESMTLQTLWEKKCQVLIFYHCPFYKQYPFLWPGKKIPAPWANTTSVRKLILFLETTLSERAPRGSFHVSQAILTPRVKTIARGLVGGLKNTLVHRNLPAILDWVKTQKPGAMGVNIITSDFVDLVDFATTVIELNDLLQEDRALAKC
ncbi:PI-PLC X domain-containing protein 2 [Sciurus carolinensis]|uniref:PI-PLC X domain-containing protein 2 n=2 Tax=Boreoeutheria TaxID=1437010 RepID=A0AA41MEL7_SCICA|nr:PI-PLC X domain-containing protein 2 [Sciurus carolinensis]